MPDGTLDAMAGDPAAMVRSIFQAVFAGDPSPFDAHPGLEALRLHLPALLSAFPDFSAELQQQLVDGDRVALDLPRHTPR